MCIVCILLRFTLRLACLGGITDLMHCQAGRICGNPWWPATVTASKTPFRLGLCEALHGSELVTELGVVEIPNKVLMSAFSTYSAVLTAADDAAIVCHQQRADVEEEQSGAADGMPFRTVLGERDPHAVFGSRIRILVVWEKQLLCCRQHLICDGQGCGEEG